MPVPTPIPDAAAGATITSAGWNAIKDAIEDLYASGTDAVPALSDLDPPTASVDMDGEKIVNLGTPSSDTDAATKAYVDSVAAGLSVKDAVRAATTGNITLSGSQGIDNVTVIAGDRVLVKNQSTASQNGIYVVASGSWSRATDADTDAEVTSGIFVLVTEGTTNGAKGFVLTTPDPITVGSTGLTFTQFNQASPSTLSVQDEGVALQTAATALNFVGDGVTATGAGSTKTITITAGGSAAHGIYLPPASDLVYGTTGVVRNATSGSFASLVTISGQTNPGDVVLIPANTYTRTSVLTITRSGTAANPIYWICQGPVILQNASNNTTPSALVGTGYVINVKAQWNVFIGPMEVRYCGQGIMFEYNGTFPSGTSPDYNRFHDVVAHDFANECWHIRYGSYNVLHRCGGYNAARNQAGTYSGTGAGEAFYIGTDYFAWSSWNGGQGASVNPIANYNRLIDCYGYNTYDENVEFKEGANFNELIGGWWDATGLRGDQLNTVDQNITVKGRYNVIRGADIRRMGKWAARTLAPNGSGQAVVGATSGNVFEAMTINTTNPVHSGATAAIELNPSTGNRVKSTIKLTGPVTTIANVATED